MAIIATQLRVYHRLLSKIEHIKNPNTSTDIPLRLNVSIQQGTIYVPTLSSLNPESMPVGKSVVDGLEYVSRNPNAFSFLLEIATVYHIPLAKSSEGLTKMLTDEYKVDMENFYKVVHESGFW